MQKKRTRLQKALSLVNLDLFSHGTFPPLAPATIHTKIQEQANRVKEAQKNREEIARNGSNGLPGEAELYRLFDRFNLLFFDGRLPATRIEFSTRMRSAGSYTPSDRLIRIGRHYHELFPNEIEDTLKHEMIHILNPSHDADFRKEAVRIGASLRARSHPSLKRPPKYVYQCRKCLKEYPRQKRLRMASCGDCSAGGKFDSRFKLKLVKNELNARKPD